MSNSINGALTTTKTARKMTHSTEGSTLADILERVLDKGIVIAGDVSISIADTELLHIRIRLLISSVDKAKEMGINWWEGDSFLSSNTGKLRQEAERLRESNLELQERLASVENELIRLRKRLLKESAERDIKNKI